MLSGIAVAETVKGIQAAGVMACTKHYIGNEQEHFRQGSPPSYLTSAISSNIDDVTMHELYLWPFADAVRAGTASVMCSYNQVSGITVGDLTNIVLTILAGQQLLRLPEFLPAELPAEE